MDQILSLLSRGKLSKGKKNRQEGYRQSIIGIEGESFQLRYQGKLPGGRGPKGGTEGGRRVWDKEITYTEGGRRVPGVVRKTQVAL